MSCQRVLFILMCVWCFCLAECTITVSPKEASKHLGDTIVLRCKYTNDIEVEWFIRIGTKDPFRVASSNENTCLKQRKTINDSHIIYRESDNVCVLEVNNLKQNVTYLCLSKADGQQDKAVVVVFQKPSTGESNAGQVTGESLGLVAIILVAVGFSLCTILCIGRYFYKRKRRRNQPNSEVGMHLITTDSNKSAATSNNLRDPTSSVIVEDNTDSIIVTNATSDASDPVKSVSQTHTTLSAEEKKDVDFVIEDFLKFKLFASEDKISIEMGNLVDVLKSLAYDGVGYMLTKGVHKVQDIYNYVDKLLKVTFSALDKDMRVLNNSKDFELISEERIRFIKNRLSKRFEKIDEKRKLAVCVGNESETSIQEKFDRMEYISDCLNDLFQSVLSDILLCEINAWKLKFRGDGSGCKYHRQEYLINKTKNFRELICKQWYSWHQEFFSAKCIKGTSSDDDEKSLRKIEIQKNNCLESISRLADVEIKELSDSCTCHVADDVMANAAVKGVIELHPRGAVKGAGSSGDLYRLSGRAHKGNDLSGTPRAEGSNNTAVHIGPARLEVDLHKAAPLGNPAGIFNPPASVSGEDSSAASRDPKSTIPFENTNLGSSCGRADISEMRRGNSTEQQVQIVNKSRSTPPPKAEAVLNLLAVGGTDAESDDKVKTLETTVLKPV